MSWSLSFSGTPEEVVQKIQDQDYTDPNSKKEYETVKEHLIGLVERNDLKRIVINAHGHSGFDSEGVEQNSECHVGITSNRI